MVFIGRNAAQLRALAMTAAAVVVLAACGSSGGGGGVKKNVPAGAINRSYAGTTISVLVPPWEAYKKSVLAEFTKRTGIKVKLTSLAWDSIHDKIVTSEAAHVAPADVTEVDWSWMGQFGAAGWYLPLNKYVTKSELQDNYVAPVFDYHGQQLAVPYNLDFRSTFVNVTDFHKAGITTMPTSWSQLLKDAQTLRAKGVLPHPVGVPLSVTEGASTPWYALIKSAGSELFDKNYKPLFTGTDSAGYKAMQFERTLYKDGLISPGAISLTDVQVGNLFGAGQVAIGLSFSPSAASTLANPSAAKIAKQHDKVAMIPLPGPTGGTGTFGLPEGLGVPKLSNHQGAATMFINWSQSQDVMTAMFKDPNSGDLPPTKSALHHLDSTHQLIDGKAILSVLPSVKPLFPQGAPTWYPQFSNDVATTLQAVVQGKRPVGAGLQSLASQVAKLRQHS